MRIRRGAMHFYFHFGRHGPVRHGARVSKHLRQSSRRYGSKLPYLTHMIDYSFETLHRLGLNPALVQPIYSQLAAATPPLGATWELVRLCEVHRESVEVDNGTLRYSARCRPRLLNALAELGHVLVVGDWALAWRESTEQAWIELTLEPINRLVRRDADGAPHARP